jgi:hypothetical protein
MWLGAGVVLGAGGTVWSRRRISTLAERARTGEITGDVVRLVDRGARRVRRRMAIAVEAGRVEARRREGELLRTGSAHHRRP